MVRRMPWTFHTARTLEQARSMCMRVVWKLFSNFDHELVLDVYFHIKVRTRTEDLRKQDKDQMMDS